MSIKLLPLFFIALCAISLQSCGRGEPTAEELATMDKTATPLPPEASQMPALPKEEIPEQDFDFGKFPNKWVALTKKGSEMVIEEPCDLDNRELRITNDNGHFQLFENMGDDGVDYTILGFEKLGKDKVSIRVRVPQSKKEQTFLCTMNEAEGTAVWKFKHEFGKQDAQELTFVDAEHAKNFKKKACQ
jgi:hypothetical protein